LRYQSSRHRHLMQESEQALEDASAGASPRESRIASRVLEDSKMHRLWEARHAELVRPIAEQNKRDPQIFELRRLETKLLHRCSLIDFISRNKIKGQQRNRLFKAFYGPRDIVDAILIEHRQYLLAGSSHLSTDHLLGVMQDTASVEHLQQYKVAYSNYFSLYCFFSSSRDTVMAKAVGSAMQDAQKRVNRLRQHLFTVRPDKGFSDFDQQAALARSGRYPVLNYPERY